MKYKKYPSYKDSGVEWLGDIPSEWLVCRNKTAFQFVKSLVGSESNNYQLLSLTLNGVIPRDIDSGKGKFPAEFDTYQKVEKNDLVFCLFDIDETPRTIGISNYNGMITGAYNVARCTLLADPKFIYYYYLSIDEYKGLKPFYTGLRKVVRTETFMNIELALPQLREQQQIANFLDNATAKIDTLIEKQTKQIELLKEKRQAVISHAVTKGINPKVPMKDSGVEWLGEIPEHWEAKKLKYISTVNDDSLSENYSEDFEINYIDIGSVTTGSINKYENMMYSTSPSRARRIVKNGDILVSTVRTYLKAIAPISLKEDNFIVSTGFAVVRSKNMIISDFMKYGLLSNYFIDLVEASSVGISYPAINASDLITFKVAIPPLQEQREVANYLDDKISKIDTLIEKSNKSIELLKEKRTALVSAAVTGKIDVRELV
ncbi:restriction endonuclease subunit S [Aliarcobacter butzleri]|uniref:restriction endonuclease subunit S n=1 Tax=Aliarcobacter butzleri TaxID=28197 RepID=UPI0021B36597|nr:restriction endonuclease subunit S [Aliarcobacter butzleri]MCT7586418.1 restriction endonuclease subunit S [Aliarcobacter butzleri]